MEIKRLSPELINDYINYLENSAFSDNEDWAGCYCLYYHWNDALEAECNECASSDVLNHRRSLAIRFIQEGKLQGYLAYVNGSVVGWCNANDKASFETLSKEKRPDLWEDTLPTTKVKSIVCFTIAPELRRKGIASQLLNRICSDAAAEGYSYVEAYPWKGGANRDYHGPYSLYEKHGFLLNKELEQEAIVRKYLCVSNMIRTERLELVALDESFSEDLLQLWGDYDVIKYTYNTLLKSPEECRNRLLDMLPKRNDNCGPSKFAILLKGKLIGIIGYPVLDNDNFKCGFFYQLIKSCWGNGYAYEAANALISYIFQLHPNATILADAVIVNPASIKILNKLGFIQTDIQEKGFTNNGIEQALIHYEMHR